MLDEHVRSDQQLAEKLTGEDQPGAESPTALVAQSNTRVQGEVEIGGSERRLRIFELFLVILVAFGGSIWGSVYPLFRGAEDSASSSNTDALVYLLLQIASSLALLGYVLCRQGYSGVNSLWTTRIKGMALPLSTVRHLVWSVRQVRVLEWSLVALVAFWGPVSHWAYDWLGHTAYAGGISRSLTGTIYSIMEMAPKAIDLGFLGYVLYRKRGSFSDIGLRWSSAGACLALPLFMAGMLIGTVQMPIIYWLGQTFGVPGWQPPDVGTMVHGRGGSFIASLLHSFLNGFFEELIVRAYVMSEVIRLTRNAWLAVAVSVSIQTSYHFYQGVPLALSHVAFFTILALFYAKTRSILPVALAHSLTNLASLWHHALQQTLPH